MVFAGEQEDVRRIHAHLFVHDPRSAVKDAENFLKIYPDSKELRLAYLQALAEKGDETAVLQEWGKAERRAPKRPVCLRDSSLGRLEKRRSFFSAQYPFKFTDWRIADTGCQSCSDAGECSPRK